MGEHRVTGADEEQFVVNIALSSGNRLVASCTNLGGGWSYCFTLFQREDIIQRLDFSRNAFAVFWPTQSGSYHVKVTAVHEDGCRLAEYSKPLQYDGTEIVIDKNIQRENVFQSTVIVLREIWKNRERMFRMAMYDFRTRNNDSYLGKIWTFLNPLIQILTFWFVFGQGMRGGRPVEGYPYLLWMLSGLLPWFFASASIVGACGSIYSKAGTVLRMQYPQTTIPVGNILVNFFDHLATMLILLVVLLMYGYAPALTWLNLLYYWMCGIIFFSVLGLVTSTLTMIARDFQKLISSLIRLLFYMTPILWTLDSMPEGTRGILKLNPVLYLVDGYRDSLLYNVNFWEHGTKTLFFWLVTLLLLLLGCSVHRRYKDYFIDLM